MASPTCTVKDGAGAPTSTSPNGVDVTAANTITLALASTAGVKTWSISCIGTDELQVAATITSGLTIDGVNKTATFTMPAAGTALVFQSSVTDNSGVVTTTTFGIYTRISGNRVGAVNETVEGSAAYGWVAKYNPIIRSPSAAPDATSGAKGIVQLAGDLGGTGGTAAAPKVSGITGVSGVATVAATHFDYTGNAKLTIRTDEANVQTTDATVTSLYTWTIANNAVTQVDAKLTAIKNGTTQGAAYARTAAFRNNAGTVAQISTTQAVLDLEDDATWDSTIDNSTTTGRVRVTGKAATTIQWGGAVQIFETIS